LTRRPTNAGEPCRTGSGYVAALWAAVEDLPVETVSLARLGAALPVRVRTEDTAHTRLLADAGEDVPPILVHRPTLRVIDGTHRVRAAVLNGLHSIGARFFDGPEHDAYLLAVAANVRHGLPLTADERQQAAVRIAAQHPDWSNRAVAAVAGTSPHRVARIRRADGTAPRAATVGLDGRSRPVDPSAGRRRAAELMLANPEFSIREVARRAAISPSTAADVKARLRSDEDPLPQRVRAAEAEAAPAGRDEPRTGEDMDALFNALCRDPSLRFSESGRMLLRMFESCARVKRQHEQIVHNLPAHCAETAQELLLGYVDWWRSMAEDLATAQQPERRPSAS
jgi:ParB-like chromosome segregation protein Spo0J